MKQSIRKEESEMSLPKAALKYVLRRGNDSHTKKELKENRGRAFKQTGQKIDEAKKRGIYINGSRNYNKSRKELDEDTLKKYQDREKFIDDL